MRRYKTWISLLVILFCFFLSGIVLSDVIPADKKEPDPPCCPICNEGECWLIDGNMIPYLPDDC